MDRKKTYSWYKMRSLKNLKKNQRRRLEKRLDDWTIFGPFLDLKEFLEKIKFSKVILKSHIQLINYQIKSLYPFLRHRRRRRNAEFYGQNGTFENSENSSDSDHFVFIKLSSTTWGESVRLKVTFGLTPRCTAFSGAAKWLVLKSG